MLTPREGCRVGGQREGKRKEWRDREKRERKTCRTGGMERDENMTELKDTGIIRCGNGGIEGRKDVGMEG